jgi:hypothetical protein
MALIRVPNRPARGIVKNWSYLALEALRMPRTANRRARFIAVAALAGSLIALTCQLGGCGYFDRFHAGRSASGASSLGQPAAPLSPAAKALAAMVDAVGPSTGDIPVELRFSIRDRPQVGQDDEVDYALVPQISGIERIHVAFVSLDGLEVTQTGPRLAAIKPASDAPIFGSVTIRPVKTGLFTLTATVAVQTASQSLMLPFRMPIIAAEGPARTAARQP